VLRDNMNGRRRAEPAKALRYCEFTPTRRVKHSNTLSQTAVAEARSCNVANHAREVLRVFLFLGEDGLE
jgi:hypothetical protein